MELAYAQWRTAQSPSEAPWPGSGAGGVSPSATCPERVTTHAGAIPGYRLRWLRQTGQTAALEPYLDVTIRDGFSSRTERHALARPEMTLGSDPVSDIVINSSVIPPRFAFIERRSGAPARLLARDPGASLYYQNMPVREHELRPGETLWAGDPKDAHVMLRYGERSPESPVRPAPGGVPEMTLPLTRVIPLIPAASPPSQR